MTKNDSTRILIIDDDNRDLSRLSDYLLSASFSIQIVFDIDQAVDEALETQPDLILLAEHLTGFDSLEICRTLHQHELVDAPIIFLLESVNSLQEVLFFAAGAVDYVIKPIQPEALLARINIHRSLDSLHEELRAQNAQLAQENVLRQELEVTLNKLNRKLTQQVKEQDSDLAQVQLALQEEIDMRRKTDEENQLLSEALKGDSEILTRLEQLKKEFLTNMSHELQTPLNGIIGLAESMIDGATGSLVPEQIYNLSMIVQNGEQLVNLIDDILDYAKLKHRELPLALRPVGIRAVVEVVVSQAEMGLENQTLQFVNNVPDNLPFVYADDTRLQQILENLTTQAVRRTKQGQIIISAALQSSEMIEVTVADTGEGFSAEELTRIFTSFTEIPPPNYSGSNGTGLGLSLTKQLVELHGGTLEVVSVPGQGTSFTFTLPRYSEARNGGPLDPKPEISLLKSEIEPLLRTTSHEFRTNRATKILVVDDDLPSVQVLTNYLRLKNYEVIQAFDGVEALEAFNEVEPDLVLLDVVIPRLSGYEVCRKMREQRAAHELPIVLLTTKGQVSDMLAGFEAGANDYLTKPFDKNRLLIRVKTHLELAKITSAYGRFVPHEFLRFLEKDSVMDLKLGDQVQRQMTILFSDIRSFTALSESMTPQQNFNFLNSYFSRISPIIREHHGFVDKYIGDGLMALFPEKVEDAVRSAIAMQQAVTLYNVHRRKYSYRPISIGIGIHTGSLMLGTIGEVQRMENTVISDAVNLAARVEGLTKLYGASILVSEKVVFALDNPTRYHFRFLDKVQVKGKQDSISVFEFFDGHPEDLINLKLETRTDFEKGLLHYHSQEFVEAKSHFDQVLALDPGDKPAQLYQQRIAHFLKYGVPPGWEGIEDMTEG